MVNDSKPCDVDENGWCHTHKGYMSNCPSKSPDPEEDIHDEPCAWCNDLGPITNDGESHPCPFCGAIS